MRGCCNPRIHPDTTCKPLSTVTLDLMFLTILPLLYLQLQNGSHAMSRMMVPLSSAAVLLHDQGRELKRIQVALSDAGCPLLIELTEPVEAHREAVLEVSSGDADDVIEGVKYLVTALCNLAHAAARVQAGREGDRRDREEEEVSDCEGRAGPLPRGLEAFAAIGICGFGKEAHTRELREELRRRVQRAIQRRR